MRRLLVVIPLGLLIVVAGAIPSRANHTPTRPIELQLTVTEPAGQTRTSDRVTSGIPIPLSATQSAWALFDGQTEIPLQTTLLNGVRTPWVLLDFQSTVNANATKTYTLKEQTPTVAPNAPVNIVTTATESTVITGPLKAVIGKTTFNLFDEVWLDKDADGQFEAGEQIISYTTNDNLPLREGMPTSSLGANQTGRGTPTVFVWEAVGPVRATLRVEGTYGNPADPLLRYTTRITFSAGRRDVHVEHLLRNSVPLQERYVKVQSAKLIAGGNGSTGRIAKAGAQAWVNPGATGSTVELIPANLEITSVFDPAAVPYVPRQQTVIDVDANGGMVIGDWSYHAGSAVFDFTESLTGQQQTDRATASADRLVALTAAFWYSDLGAFGAEHFGTLEDETATYQRWGWQWPTPGNAYSSPSAMPRVKNTYRIDWSTFDAGDFEADDLWMNIMMFVRTGQRGYLDRSDALARYWKHEFAWRSDGFDYLRDDYWSGPNRAPTFTRYDLPNGSFTANDTAYVTYNIKYGKDDGNHTWNAGLIDYYYLFGDTDALTAAVDFAERAKQYTYYRVPGTVAGDIGGNPRSSGRHLTELLRTWEATGDQQWRTAADHVRNMFMQAISYDPRGFYYGSTNDTTRDNVNIRYPNAKYFSAFMLGVVNQAFYRYWLLTGDAAVRARIIEMADFALEHGTGPEGYTGDNTLIDYPTPGNVIHMTYDEFRNDNPTYHYSFSGSSGAFIDMLTVAYRLTGNQAYLQKAKFLWGKTSKRIGVNAYTNLLADDAHVGRWLNSLLNNYSSTLYPENWDLMTTQFLFYDAVRVDDTSPAITTDLRAN